MRACRPCSNIVTISNPECHPPRDRGRVVLPQEARVLEAGYCFCSPYRLGARGAAGWRQGAAPGSSQELEGGCCSLFPLETKS